MQTREPCIVAVAFEPDHLAHWVSLLGETLPARVQLQGCSSLEQLQATDPEVIVGHQQGFILDFLVQPAPRLRWVHILSAGVDSALERLAGTRPSFRMTTASGIHGRAMSEYAFAMMLHFSKHLAVWSEDQRARRWQPASPDLLSDCTLLVVGAGAIGRAVAETGAHFGMRVVGVSQHGTPLPGFDEVVPAQRLRDVLPEADFVVLAVPLTSQSRGMIDRDAFAAMKHGAVLINLARGALLDETALLESLERGHLAGAALDVFVTEPLPAESPLWPRRTSS